jgi:hypothetical protein
MIFSSQRRAVEKYRKTVVQFPMLKETHAKLKKLSILGNVPMIQIVDLLINEYYEYLKEASKSKE